MRLDPVRLKKIAYKFNNLYSNDPIRGTLDLETYKTKDISKVYAIAFYTSRYGVKTFFLHKSWYSWLKQINYKLFRFYVG